MIRSHLVWGQSYTQRQLFLFFETYFSSMESKVFFVVDCTLIPSERGHRIEAILFLRPSQRLCTWESVNEQQRQKGVRSEWITIFSSDSSGIVFELHTHQSSRARPPQSSSKAWAPSCGFPGGSWCRRTCCTCGSGSRTASHRHPHTSQQHRNISYKGAIWFEHKKYQKNCIITETL